VKPQPSTVGNPLNLPTCGQCRRLMAVTRIEPDWLRDDGSEVQTFECAACGGSVTRFIPEGTGRRAWNASDYPKHQIKIPGGW